MTQLYTATLCALTAATAMAGTPRLTPESIVTRTPDTAIAAPVKAVTELNHRPVIRKESAGDAENSFDFSNSFDPYTTLSLGANMIGTETFQGFVFSKEYADLYAGAQITAINVYSGINDATETNELTDVTVYLMESPDGNPFRTQKATISADPQTLNRITLDEPYTIEAGKSFFVSYSLVPKDQNDFYITVDALPRVNMDGCYIGFFNGSNYEWLQAANEVGNISMGVTIESENLPSNGMDIFTYQAPDFVTPGEPFSTTIYLYNTAHNPVNTLEVEYIIGDDKPQTVEWSFEKPLGNSVMANGILKDMVCNQTGASVPLKVRISKVNGEPNIGINPSFETTFTCLRLEDGFKRNILVEEGTGTWCGYCPAGIVFMEHIREMYPEDAIRVAIHAGGQNSPDPMEVKSASSLISMFTGFPQLKLNRTYEMTPTEENINQKFADFMEAERRKAAVAEISDISVDFLSAKNISLKAKARFAIDLPNDLRYGISFFITEDNVGPYNQTNYFAGSTDEMGGWEKKKRVVSTIYDDVLRVCLGGISGYTDVFPEEIKAFTEYECTDNTSIKNVTDSDFFVTALIIDNITGAVINSRQINVVNSGVDTLEADGASVKVAGSNGCIMISGAYNQASVYDFGGVKIAEANGASVIDLPAGFYIVTIDGTSHKVSVK